MGTSPVDDAPIALALARRHGIWRIKKDGVFYGDYRSKADGIEAANAAAGVLRQAGRSVTIVIAPIQDAP
jgi:hypothetical protein